MFQFSKVMPHHHGVPKKPKTTAEEYFATWISWFKSRGILTEIRHNSKGSSLWRDGIEATERNTRKNNP